MSLKSKNSNNSKSDLDTQNNRLQPSSSTAPSLSLEGMHGSVKIPPDDAGFWRQWRAFVGPAVLVSVGYMDPGNWGTDLAGGAQFKYGLLWVVALASVMAIFLQVIAARLGIVTGKDLAQCFRDWYPQWTRMPLWLFSEIAIGACDLAEVLGSAVALNLMFHIPLLWAVVITAGDVLLLLALQRFGMRTIEAVVLLLVATMGICYYIELFILPQLQPEFSRNGPCYPDTYLPAIRNDVYRNRYCRSNGYAAQSFSALCFGAKPPTAEG